MVLSLVSLHESSISVPSNTKLCGHTESVDGKCIQCMCVKETDSTQNVIHSLICTFAG